MSGSWAAFTRHTPITPIVSEFRQKMDNQRPLFERDQFHARFLRRFPGHFHGRGRNQISDESLFARVAGPHPGGIPGVRQRDSDHIRAARGLDSPASRGGQTGENLPAGAARDRYFGKYGESGFRRLEKKRMPRDWRRSKRLGKRAIEIREKDGPRFGNLRKTGRPEGIDRNSPGRKRLSPGTESRPRSPCRCF